MSDKIRVLIVDDSPLIRDILTDGLSQDPEIEVVGGAGDPFAAIEKIKELKPDVLTLDIEMPKMNGLEFLKRFMPQHPLPVVMVSSYTEKGKSITMEALEAGAVDFVPKRNLNSDTGMGTIIEEIADKVKAAALADVSHWKDKQEAVEDRLETSRALDVASRKVVAIGASTGGPEAIRRVLFRLPANMPGVLVVVHMPEDYTQMFAERLNEYCALDVREARTGDVIKRGVALIAPGGRQLAVSKTRTDYQVYCLKGEKVSGHCPSVDFMMNSVAENFGAAAVGVMLTGMGNDGAKGMLAMRNAGARTIAQDQETSVVFGMPKIAHDTGAAEKLVAIDDIPPTVIELLTNPSSRL